MRQKGVRAPATITVDGQPYSLAKGRHFLYFFNPMCEHCAEAAKKMSKLDWGDTKIVGVPVEMPQFAQQFLNESGLHAGISTDFEKLKDVFAYTAYPFGVALENGRQKAPLTMFNDAEPVATLRKLGMAR